MTPRPRLPPLRWEDVCAALAIALLVRWIVGDDAGAVQGAFGWFFVIVGAIWSALQSTWQVIHTALTYALRWTLISLRWAITNVAKGLATGLAKTATFLAKTVGLVWRGLRYVFEPLFRVIQKGFTSLVGFLRRVFVPVIDFLNRVRGWVQSVYNNWVRPILNAIDIVRQILRILAQLGFDWARALDAALGRLSAKISFPFTFVIAKINEAIGWINKIVTLDGLVQRLTLMRSLIRDVNFTNRLWWNSQTREYSAGDVAAIRHRNALPTIAARELEYVEAIESDSGPLAAAAREWWQDFELRKHQPLGTERLAHVDED